MHRILVWQVFALTALAQDDAAWRRLMARAENLQNQSRYSEAESALREALLKAHAFGPRDARVALAWNNLGSVRQETGRCLEAKSAYERALAIWRQSREKGTDRAHLKTANNLVSVHLDCGYPEQAEKLFNRYLSRALEASDLDGVDRARLLNNKGAILFLKRRFAEAEPVYKEALDYWQRTLGPRHHFVALMWNNLAVLYGTWGHPAEALPAARRSVEILEANGPARLALLRAWVNLAAILAELHLYGESELLFQRALSAATADFGSDHPLVSSVLSSYAAMLGKAKRKPEAREMAERAKTIQTLVPRLDHTVDVSELAK